MSGSKDLSSHDRYTRNSNATGADAPRRSEDAQEWTVELCSKRLSLLHRKLRQVKDLLVKQARDPGSLDDAQLVKIGRKEDLRVRGEPIV